MIRLTLLIIAVATVLPFGCPPAPTPPGEDNSLVGTLQPEAEAPAAATVGQTVLMNARLPGSDAAALTFSWFQTAGPGVALSNAGTASASFKAPSLPATSTLTFAVTVRNAAGATGQASVSVQVERDENYQPYDFSSLPPGTVGATGPQANAGQDRKINQGETVTLDGSGSTGSALTYAWRQTSGRAVTLQGASTVKATFVAPDYESSGDNVLRFELAVTDRQNRTVTDRVRLEIRDPAKTNPVVEVRTTLGNFQIELFEEEAPISVENFLKYVDDGFYDGTIFHRVIAGFVIQGGGYTPGLNEKTPRDPIRNESFNGLKNLRGTVAYARTTDPDSATSQWFVNLVDNAFLDRTSSNAGYAVFGKVIEGLSVVDAIGSVPTGDQGGFNDVPVTDVIIQSVKRVTTGGSETKSGETGDVRPPASETQ